MKIDKAQSTIAFYRGSSSIVFFQFERILSFDLTKAERIVHNDISDFKLIDRLIELNEKNL